MAKATFKTREFCLEVKGPEEFVSEEMEEQSCLPQEKMSWYESQK